MKAMNASMKPRQLTRQLIKRNKRITEDAKKIKNIMKNDTDMILNKTKRMSEEIGSQQGKEDEEIIKQVTRKSKSTYKESNDITIYRNDILLRRGYILLKEPQDEDVFNERLGIALQRPDNTDVRQDDNDEPFTVYGLTSMRMWQDVNNKCTAADYASTERTESTSIWRSLCLFCLRAYLSRESCKVLCNTQGLSYSSPFPYTHSPETSGVCVVMERPIASA